MEDLGQDLRYGVRMLLKYPGFTTIAILTLALGIGANTAIFSIINAVLLQPYPHIETDRWVYVWEHPNLEGLSQVSASVPNYRDWKQQSRSFTEMVLWRPWSYNLSGSGTGEPERVLAAVVTTNLFSALNLVPAAGRMPVEADGKSTERLVVISYGIWKRHFGGDPNLAGKQIKLNLAPHTVLGVAPPEFSFPPETKTDIWTVYSQSAIDSNMDRSGRGYRVAAKLKPGLSLPIAQAEMDLIAGRLAAQYEEDKGFGIQLVAMREGVAGDFQRPLLALFGALGLVLLLACVNLANLQLVRFEARRKELAMRTALGAGRGRLIRQLVTESMLLVVLAGLLGVFLAPEGVRLLLWLVPPEQIPWLKVVSDGRVLLVCTGLTLLTAVLSGLLPAIRSSSFDLARMLAASSSGSGGAGINRRWRNAFVVAQLALTFIPLVGAGLLMNSFVRLRGVDPGFQTDHRLTLSLSAPRARYKDPAAIARLAEQVGEEVRHAPGVREAGLVQYLPFSPAVGWLQAVSRQDPQGHGNPADLPHVRYTVASTGYFESLGIPLKAGRTFTNADTRESVQIVVINEALAKRYFPNEDPIGKPLWIGHAQMLPGSLPRTIVGVVGDTLLDRLDTAPEASAWVPISQQSFGEDLWRTLFLVVKTDIEPQAALAGVRQRIAGIDSELALTGIATMEDRLGESVWRQRFTASVLGVFSFIAMAIAMLGVFGITSYLVRERTHEIGVRMALGAMPGDIFRLIMKEGILSVLTGVALGMAGALALARFLSNLLYGVRANDPVTFGAVAVLLALVALAACCIPARRAAKADPLIALKHE
jgi:putative ABC transport system permease protein